MSSDIGEINPAGLTDSLHENEEGDLETEIIDATSNLPMSNISITNPKIGDALWQKMTFKSMKIDKCKISYRPQCPFNSAGRVEVEIRDTRLRADDQLQARFTFPVTCPVDITYFGNAYAAADKNGCPWTASYRLLQTNINDGVKYCKIKATLAFQTSSFPDEITYRPPLITVLSKVFDNTHVDIWHVDRKISKARLTRSNSESHFRSTKTLAAPMGHYGSSAQRIMAARMSASSIRDGPQSFSRRDIILPTQGPSIFNTGANNQPSGPVDIGPSVSEAGSNNSESSRLTTDEAGKLIEAVKAAVEATTSAQKANVQRRQL
ncbi:movement protein [Camellia oleifera geminivirus]|nr:movement protein [Camellia oleifera geminivirus]